MTSAAEKPDPMTRSGLLDVSRFATGASRGGGGMLTVKIPEASTKCLHRIPKEPIANPRAVRYMPSTLVAEYTASEMPTACGYAFK